MPWNEVKLALTDRNITHRHMQRTITISSRMLPAFLLQTCAKALAEICCCEGSHCAGELICCLGPLLFVRVTPVIM